MRRQFLTLAAAAAVAAAVPVAAQDKAPLKILVGFPPGGSADVIARLLADGLRDDFSQVVVENRPGAGGRGGEGQELS
ncbi:MAG: twin-arginine translocation signal domain-containing protein, partial [Comamonadaceae bacterium]